MKKRILLFTAIAGMCYVTLSSYSGGAAGSGQNRTGAKGGALTSCGGAGCHGTGTATSVTITVDSAGVPVTKYSPGKTYTVKIAGTNSSSLPKFGFQFVAVSGTGTAQAQAGTYSVLPSGTMSHSLSSLNYVEQMGAMTAATPGTYNVQFDWTAPTSSSLGDITLYCTLNAVNGTGAADASDISGNVSKVMKMNMVPSSVATTIAAMEVKAFPNPATNNMNLQLTNAQAGTYSVQVFSLGGKLVANETVTVTGANNTLSLNTGNWAAGTYMVSVENNGSRKVIPVVKQ